jgi:hypothetical protein
VVENVKTFEAAPVTAQLREVVEAEAR